MQNEVVGLTEPEQKFFDLMVDYEIMSMVKDLRTQVWVKTSTGRRRIDFVLFISTTPNDHKGIYIEIDDPRHETPQGRFNDEIKEQEIFNYRFPLLRFSYYEIFNDTQRVMNKIEGMIESMRCV